MATEKDTTARSIEDLTEEYKRLNERKIQADTQLKTATEQLEALQKEAVDKFGTSDIDELKTQLAAMEKENEDRRSEYQKLLEGISSDLAKVEADEAAGKTKQSDDE